MKALSLWQPWASLLIIKAKEYETRHWPAPASQIGQPILIHAAKVMNSPARTRFYREGLIYEVLRHEYPSFESMPFGAYLGIATLAGSERITVHNTPAAPEYNYGDYTPGRYMWKLEHPMRFEKPIIGRGAQGFFNPPTLGPDQVAQLEQHYRLWLKAWRKEHVHA